MQYSFDKIKIKKKYISKDPFALTRCTATTEIPNCIRSNIISLKRFNGVIILSIIESCGKIDIKKYITLPGV